MPYVKREGVLLFQVPRPSAPDTLAPMKWFALLLAAGSLLAFAPQKAKKPADVEILETKVARDAGRISVDGRVKVTAEKPLRGLILIFDFRSRKRKLSPPRSPSSTPLRSNRVTKAYFTMRWWMLPAL